jgi:hypothetical protein
VLTRNHSIVLYMPMDSLFVPFGQVLRKLCMLKPWSLWEPLPCHCCTKHDLETTQLPYLLAHTSNECILEYAYHNHGFTLVTLSLCRWEASPTLGALTHMRITWPFSPTAPQISGVPSGYLLCRWWFGEVCKTKPLHISFADALWAPFEMFATISLVGIIHH